MALLYLLGFPILGAAVSVFAFPKVRREMAAWLGAAAGFALLIWLPVLVGCISGRFTSLNVHLSALFFFILCAAVVFLNRKKRNAFRTFSPLPLSFWLVGAAFLVLMGILYYNHVLMPRNGDLYGGQSTYGDLSMHLGFITSLAEQGHFPPEYNLYPGALLSYPFLIDSLSSELLLLGLPLSWSVICPSLVCCALLYVGLYFLFLEAARTHARALFSILLFLFAGGLGVFWYLDGAAAEPHNFTQMFTEYYHAPTNFTDVDLRWVNPICDMLVPQRTTMLGWAMLPPVLFCLQRGLKEDSYAWMITAGIFAGSMPMMHTHSYLAAGIVAFGWVLAYAPWKDPKAWISYLLRWASFGLPAIGLALPQLFTWTFRQATGDAFLRLGMDWVNERDPSWWFWLKNLGLAGFLFLPALWAKRREVLAFQSGAWILWGLAMLFYFQPNPYDNNKLLLVWYLLCLPGTAWYLEDLWRALKAVPGRAWFAGAALLLLFTSGVFSVVREIRSGGEYMLFSAEDKAAAEFVREHTDPDDLFVTGRQHLNPVAVLAGRSVWCGTDLYLYWHGLDTRERERDLEQIYTDPETSREVLERIGAKYIYVSDYERYNYPGCTFLLEERYPAVYEDGHRTIYEVTP